MIYFIWDIGKSFFVFLFFTLLVIKAVINACFMQICIANYIPFFFFFLSFLFFSGKMTGIAGDRAISVKDHMRTSVIKPNRGGI